MSTTLLAHSTLYTMTSKEIIVNYLDRDLLDAVGEDTIKKIIKTETQNQLSPTETQLLTLIFQRRHDMTSMERVRRDISELNLVHVVNTEKPTNSNNSDDNALVFIQKLQKLNEILETKVDKLVIQRSAAVERVEQLNDKNGIQEEIPIVDYGNTTREIHEFITKHL